jgi:hypothetical protein
MFALTEPSSNSAEPPCPRLPTSSMVAGWQALRSTLAEPASRTWNCVRWLLVAEGGRSAHWCRHG